MFLAGPSLSLSLSICLASENFIVVPTKMKFGLIVVMAGGEDIETQQKGFCGVFYQSNPSAMTFKSRSDRDLMRRTLLWYPVRFSAMHVCLPNHPAFSVVKTLAMASASLEVRARMRFHTGEL
jgi:hypothetical protein